MRGYQKKVIYLKNTGSSIFEEAYFIVKPEQKKKNTTNEMVDEANRILEEVYGKEKRTFSARFIRYAISFASGSIFTLIIVLFFNLLCR